MPSSRVMRVCQTLVRPPLWIGVAVPVTVVPSFAAPRKLVLLSIVVVPLASFGMERTVPSAPSASAKAMIAPPCRMWPAVHRSGRTSSVATTWSGPASTTFTPISLAKGMRSAMFSVMRRLLPLGPVMIAGACAQHQRPGR